MSDGQQGTQQGNVVQLPKRPPRKPRVQVERDPTKTCLVMVEGKGLFMRRWEEDEAAPTGQRPVDTQVTDCDLQVECVVDLDGEQHIKVLVVVDGQAPRRATIQAAELEDCRKLNAWGTRVAMRAWNIQEEERWELKKYLMGQDGARRVVFTPRTGGWQPDHGVWLMQGVAVDAGGYPIEHTPGEATGPVVCADGNTREFMVPPSAPHLVVFGHYTETNAERDTARLEARGTLRDFCAALRDNLGHHGGALALGWLVAGLRRDAVVRRELAFPLLYLHAAFQQGKNTFGDILMKTAGVVGMPIMAGQGTTSVGLRDTASEVNNVPMWLDEMRNDETCNRYMSWVRGSFDGSTQVVGSRAQTGRVTHKPVRPVMLSGQDLFGSDAERSRYVVIKLEKRTVNRAAYPRVQEMQTAARLAYARLLSESVETSWCSSLLWAVDMHRDLLARTAAHQGAVVSDRQLFCWSVPLAGLMMMLCPDPTVYSGSGVDHGVYPREVFDEAVARMVGTSADATQDSAVARFWDQLETMAARGWLGNTGNSMWCRTVHRGDEDLVAVWLGFLQTRLREQNRDRTDSDGLMKTEFSADPNFVGFGKTRFGLAEASRCMFMRKSALPAWVVRLATAAGMEPDEEG